jgi:carboxypeptidase Q
MRNILLLIACVGFAAAARAQASLESTDTDTTMSHRIRLEEASHSQVAWIAHQLTDVAGPRLTGSPGFLRGADWAVRTLKGWGLSGAAKETWGEFGIGWSTHYAYGALKAPYYQPMIVHPRAWSPSTPGLISGNVVVLDALDSASVDRAGDAVKGAIIVLKSKSLILGGDIFKPDATRLNADSLNTLPDADMVARSEIDQDGVILKSQQATKQYLHNKGALALLVSYRGFRGGTIPADGDWLQGTGRYPALLPEVAVDRENYLRLQRLVADKAAPVLVELDIRNEMTPHAQGYNVVADIPGTDPSLGIQLVMLGGHLDSWQSATGATDNGSGCIVMMEAVRLLQTLGLHPRRTIRIALWGGEEEGLLGSFGYVLRHFGDPVTMKLTAEQPKVSAYFNLDNGTGRIRGIYLQQDSAARPIFQSWLAPFADLGATGLTYSNTGSTDHLSFDAVGIPGFQFIQDPLDYDTRTHHTNMDSYDHLSIPDMEQASIIVATFVYNAAMRDGMIPRKPLPAAGKSVFDFRGLF